MHFRQNPLTSRSLRALCSQGFTVVELMVTVAVMAVLLGIAAPSFNDALLSTKLSAYANSLVSSSFLARSEAIKRNSVVSLCVSADGTTCSSGGWEQGWIVLSGTTVLHRQTAATTGFKFTGSVSQIDFQPTGVGATVSTIVVCRATPPGKQEREVRISATGRATVTKTITGTCT